MSRDHAYEFLRIGSGDRAGRHDHTRARRPRRCARRRRPDQFAEVQWMGVLRSLSALQMYQRATSSPIDGEAVIDFLLHDRAFPRSVMSCLQTVRDSLSRLPRGDQLAPALADVFADGGAGERRRARRRRARRRDRTAASRDRHAQRCHHRHVCRRPRVASRCPATSVDAGWLRRSRRRDRARPDRSWRLAVAHRRIG